MPQFIVSTLADVYARWKKYPEQSLTVGLPYRDGCAQVLGLTPTHSGFYSVILEGADEPIVVHGQEQVIPIDVHQPKEHYENFGLY